MTNSHLDADVALLIADEILGDTSIFNVIYDDVKRRRCYFGDWKDYKTSRRRYFFKGHPRIKHVLNSVWESIVCGLMRMDRTDAWGRRRSLLHILECETHKISREVMNAMPRYMPDSVIKKAVRQARRRSISKWTKSKKN